MLVYAAMGFLGGCAYGAVNRLSSWLGWMVVMCLLGYAAGAVGLGGIAWAFTSMELYVFLAGLGLGWIIGHLAVDRMFLWINDRHS